MSDAIEAADPSFPDALPDNQIRIWINSCNHEPTRQALRQLLAYRVRGVTFQTCQCSPTCQNIRGNAVCAKAGGVTVKKPRIYKFDGAWRITFNLPTGDTQLFVLKRGSNLNKAFRYLRLLHLYGMVQ